MSNRSSTDHDHDGTSNNLHNTFTILLNLLTLATEGYIEHEHVQSTGINLQFKLISEGPWTPMQLQYEMELQR